MDLGGTQTPGLFNFKHIYLKQSALLTVQSQTLRVLWFLLIRALPRQGTFPLLSTNSTLCPGQAALSLSSVLQSSVLPCMCFQNITCLPKREHCGPVLSGFESQFFQPYFLKKTLKSCLTSLCLGFFIWKTEIIIVSVAWRC